MAIGTDITARQRLNVVLETVPGTYDPAGFQVLATDYRGDYQEKTDRGKHRNEGDNAKAYVHNKKRWVELAGDFDPCFRSIEKWIKLGFQVTNDDIIATGPNAGGRRIVAILPNDASVDRKTATIEWGKKASCKRSQLGLLTSLTIKNDATGECVGTVALKARKPSARGVGMTGAVAGNEKYALNSGAGASGSLGVTYTLPGGAPVGVTILPTDTALQIKAKFESAAPVPGSVTVNVVGAFSATNEVQTITSGAGYLGGATPFVLTNPNNPAQTATVNVTPGDSLATIGANLSAAFSTWLAGAVVTAGGTFTAASGGTPSYVVSACSDPSFLGTYTQNGATQNGAPIYQIGTGAAARYLQSFFYNGVYQWALGYNLCPTTPTTGTFYYSSQSSGAQNQPVTLTGFPGGAGLTMTAGPLVGATGGSLALTLTCSGSLAGVNVPQITCAAAGVTCATTTQGLTTGAPTVEFASPANTRVVLTKTSGDANYTLVETQAGSTGVPFKHKPAPIGPRMWRAFRTPTLPDIAVDPDVSFKIGTLLNHEISYADLVKEVDFEDDDDSFQSWQDGVDMQAGLKVTAKATVAYAESGTVAAMLTEANDPVDGNGDADVVPTANWYRFRAKRGRYRLALDLFACVEDAHNLKDAGGVYAVEFPFGVVTNDAAGFFARIVLELPASS